MKKNNLSIFCLGLSILLTSGVKYFSSGNYKYAPLTIEAKQGEPKNEWAGSLEYYYSRWADISTGKIDIQDIYRMRDELNNQSRNKMGTGFVKWDEMGPINYGGRTMAFHVDKDSSNILYAGGVSGGIWKSTNAGLSWSRFGGTDQQNIIVSAITQSADGTIYYGTGEQFSGGSGSKVSGFFGGGIFKKSKTDAVFTLLTKTSSWIYVNAMAADPSNANRVYAATNLGLKYTDDAGANWLSFNSLTTESNKVGVSNCYDLKISPDGNVIYVLVKGINTGYVFRSDDKGTTWKKTSTGLPVGMGRGTIAISLSKPEVLYTCLAGTDGRFDGLFITEDKGETWTRIGKGSALFDPFSNSSASFGQGDYDNCVVVDPKNPYLAYVGGVQLWKCEKSSGKFVWAQVASLSDFLDEDELFRNPYYLHADKHILVFDPKPEKYVLYVGTDGGLFKSTDISYNKAPTYTPINYGFGTIQYWSLAVNPNNSNEAFGGTQDNSNIIVDRTGLTHRNGKLISSGDGGDAAISKLIPNLYFLESQYGALVRSVNKGKSFDSKFYDDTFMVKKRDGQGTFFPFVTPFKLWESNNDTNSLDYVKYTTDSGVTIKAGTVIDVTSRTGITFKYTVTKTINPLETVYIKDLVQSKFLVGGRNTIYFTKGALITGGSGLWFPIASIPGFEPMTIEFSADGDAAFVGGYGSGSGRVYRISGLQGKNFRYGTSYDATKKIWIRDYAKFRPDTFGVKTELIFSQGGQAVTGLGINENNSNQLVVTLGSYGGGSHVYITNKALTAYQADFSSIQGNLPYMPVYAAAINFNKASEIYVGTELGVWRADYNGTSATWYEENEGMERVPCFAIKAMRFYPWQKEPVYYLSTHGRGIFQANANAVSIKNNEQSFASDLTMKIYPNPAKTNTMVQVTTNQLSDVSISVYSIEGKLMKSLKYSKQPAGQHSYNLDVNSLKPGTYLIKTKAGDVTRTGRLLRVE